MRLRSSAITKGSAILIFIYIFCQLMFYITSFCIIFKWQIELSSIFSEEKTSRGAFLSVGFLLASLQFGGKYRARVFFFFLLSFHFLLRMFRPREA